MGLLLGWTPPAVTPGDPEFVFRGTDNRALDPEDLTGAAWTEIDALAALSDEYYDGKRFTKITNVGANFGQVVQNFNDTWTTLAPSFSVLARKGNSINNVTRFQVNNSTIGPNVFLLIIDWDNYPNAPGTPSIGTLHGYEWKDSKTVEVRCICATLTNLTDNLVLFCYGSNNAIADEYTYWTAVQAEDLPYPTPYVNGIRAAAHPDENFIMPSQFVLDMVVNPWFTYDTGINGVLFVWRKDGTHRLILFYSPGDDKIRLFWIDGGTARSLYSQQFDDGSSFTDINQLLRIIAIIDLTTGTNLGSRFIVIPLESGAIFEDTIWSGVIDPHGSAFPTLSIGHQLDADQIDGRIKYANIYKGTYDLPINNNADADKMVYYLTRAGLNLTGKQEPILIDRTQGDPRLVLTENGSKIVYKGGQPVMDQGVENLALISLFTRRGWVGNILFKDPLQKIGSDFIDAGLEPITLGSLNTVRDAAIKALNHPLFGTVDVMVSNPTSYQTKVDIILMPPGEDIKTLTLVKNGLNWIVQGTDPASGRI